MVRGFELKNWDGVSFEILKGEVKEIVEGKVKVKAKKARDEEKIKKVEEVKPEKKDEAKRTEQAVKKSWL